MTARGEGEARVGEGEGREEEEKEKGGERILVYIVGIASLPLFPRPRRLPFPLLRSPTLTLSYRHPPSPKRLSCLSPVPCLLCTQPQPFPCPSPASLAESIPPFPHHLVFSSHAPFAAAAASCLLSGFTLAPSPSPCLPAARSPSPFRPSPPTPPPPRPPPFFLVIRIPPPLRFSLSFLPAPPFLPINPSPLHPLLYPLDLSLAGGHLRAFLRCAARLHRRNHRKPPSPLGLALFQDSLICCSYTSHDVQDMQTCCSHT